MGIGGVGPFRFPRHDARIEVLSCTNGVLSQSSETCTERPCEQEQTAIFFGGRVTSVNEYKATFFWHGVKENSCGYTKW